MQRCHSGAELIFHTVPEESLDAFVPGPGNSRMYYARIQMASLLADVARVIYLDSDLLLMGDLCELWESDPGGSVAMACRDRKVLRLSDDAPWPLAPEEEGLPYFNSGVMLVDLDKWRAENVEQKCLDLISKPCGPCRWWDQTILNHVIRGKVGFLPPQWNWQSEEVPAPGEPAPRILHYTTGLKPWLYWGGSLRFQAWRECYRAFAGSPVRLLHENGSRRGLINGLFDALLDRSHLARCLYLAHLKLALKLSGKNERTDLIEQKIHFLTSSLPLASHAIIPERNNCSRNYKSGFRQELQDNPACHEDGHQSRSTGLITTPSNTTPKNDRYIRKCSSH